MDGIHLPCCAHNQYEAERTFGAGFMVQKRQEARRLAAENRLLKRYIKNWPEADETAK